MQVYVNYGFLFGLFGRKMEFSYGENNWVITLILKIILFFILMSPSAVCCILYIAGACLLHFYNL